MYPTNLSKRVFRYFEQMILHGLFVLRVTVGLALLALFCMGVLLLDQLTPP